MHLIFFWFFSTLFFSFSSFVWYLTGHLPDVINDVVVRKACAIGRFSFCQEEISIQIKKCDENSYVYFLYPTATCEMSYCFGKNIIIWSAWHIKVCTQIFNNNNMYGFLWNFSFRHTFLAVFFGTCFICILRYPTLPFWEYSEILECQTYSYLTNKFENVTYCVCMNILQCATFNCLDRIDIRCYT